MSNFLSLSGLGGDDFWAELDREYYKAFPDQWGTDSDLFISGLDYTDVIEGKRNNHFRQREINEKVTSNFIERDGYHVWEVDRIYLVKPHTQPMRESTITDQTKKDKVISEGYSVGITPDNIIGKLKLVNIVVGKKRLFEKGPIYDELIFEKCD